MSYKVVLHRQFDHDVKRLKQSGWKMATLQSFVSDVSKGPPFPKKYRIHKLKGSLEHTWDAHVTHNWVVLFRYTDDDTIELLRTGTHASLSLS